MSIEVLIHSGRSNSSILSLTVKRHWKIFLIQETLVSTDQFILH